MANYKIPEMKIAVTLENLSEAISLRTSSMVYNILHDLYDQGSVYYQEEMIMIMLNQANKVIAYKRVSQGGVAGTVVDAKIVFLNALQTPGCASIVLSHNHPSGNLKPSAQDIALTKKIAEGARILDLKLQDHIIYTPNGYFSFIDEDML